MPQNSDPEQYPLGISFVDTTIDPENPGKIYKLSDFALKTDISAGVDLTNYNGNWNLTVNTTYSDTPCIYEFSTTKIIPNGEQPEQTEPIVVLQATMSLSESDPYYAGLALAGNRPHLYMGNITPGDIITGNFPVETDKDWFTYVSTPGSLQCVYHEKGSQDIKGCSVSCEGRGIVIGSTIGSIYFQDSTIQDEEFTLKSLVDRIAALETQVTELQSQLAAKANTASPTFTGKVSINSSN